MVVVREMLHGQKINGRDTHGAEREAVEITHQGATIELWLGTDFSKTTKVPCTMHTFENGVFRRRLSTPLTSHNAFFPNLSAVYYYIVVLNITNQSCFWKIYFEF